MKLPLRVLSLLLPALFALACGSTEGEPVRWTGPGRAAAVATAYTTRLPASSAEEQAISLSQAVYAATREENAPGAILLTRQDVAEAYTAMHRITHMPVNAPLLYLGQDGLPSEATLREMERLRPEGVLQDGNVQVYLAGDFPPEAARVIRRRLGYKVRELRAADPVQLAELLDRWQAALKSDHSDEVVISALDHPEGIAHGIGAMGWNAHMGKGFAWVRRGSVPEETRRILSRRFGAAYLYLTGDQSVISDEVARELARYGLVRRVAGPDPFASNVVNAGYKDFGRNFGWWVGQQPRGFGWGISQSGHNFIFGSLDDLLGAIPAVVLGHMGKHGPLLLVERGRVPEVVSEYLNGLRPYPSGPSETILNHAWVLGDESRISWDVQKEIHHLMSPRTPLAAQGDGGGRP